MLSQHEQLRYSRQIRLPGVGIEGQERLKDGRVLIVGAGGLGNPAALYLAAAGVGYIHLIDDDQVELSNLQRQVAFSTTNLGGKKAEELATRCRELNPSVEVVATVGRFDRGNAEQLVSSVALCVDATDNLATRYLLNDVCTALQKPWIYGSVFRFEGQVAKFQPGGACYRCLFPELPTAVLNCAEAGVFGVLPGTIATLQANLVLQYFLEPKVIGTDELVMFDGRNLQLRKFALAKETACPTCSRSAEQILAQLREEVQVCVTVHEMTAQDLRLRMRDEPVTLVDVREEKERAEGAILPSVHIPYSLWTERWSELQHLKNIVLYCASGGRSYRAAAFLNQRQMTVASLKGGYQSWLETKPVERGEVV